LTMSSTDALKKPQTAYFLYLNANREKIISIVGCKDIGKVGKKAAELWGKASAAEKAPFEKEAKELKAKYDAYIATPEGQKALEAKKAEKKEEKQAKDEKEAERAKKKEEKEQNKEKRACAAAVKAVEKDDKLKKPLTAYFMWLNENREKIVAMVGSAKGPDVGKKGGEMWKKMSPKEQKPWVDRNQEEKAKYEAYIATPAGAAALKAYKEAKDAAAYKEPAKAEEEAAEEEEKKESPKKRKVDVSSTGTEPAVKKTKSAKAGA